MTGKIQSYRPRDRQSLKSTLETQAYAMVAAKYRGCGPEDRRADMVMPQKNRRPSELSG